MPRYIYEVITESGEPGERFEVIQNMADDPLTVHPETGAPVRRVFTPPWIAGKHAPARTERTLSDNSKLERLGFTKYVKSDRGYDKVVGSGPKVIKKDRK